MIRGPPKEWYQRKPPSASITTKLRMEPSQLQGNIKRGNRLGTDRATSSSTCRGNGPDPVRTVPDASSSPSLTTTQSMGCSAGRSHNVSPCWTAGSALRKVRGASSGIVNRISTSAGRSSGTSQASRKSLRRLRLQPTKGSPAATVSALTDSPQPATTSAAKAHRPPFMVRPARGNESPARAR